MSCLRQEVGEQAVNTWFGIVARAVRYHDATWLVGDFNMSLWRVVPALRTRGCGVNVVAWYAWQMEGCTGARRAENGRIHFDSTIIMVCKSCQSIDRAMSDQNLDDPDHVTRRKYPGDSIHGSGVSRPMDKWEEGQGYVMTSYKGGLKTAQEALSHVHHGHGDPELPNVKQKFIDVHQWDGQASMHSWQSRGPRQEKPAWALWKGGGHMLLLAYVNGRPRRSDEAETRREERSIARGAGPGSKIRAKSYAGSTRTRGHGAAPQQQPSQQPPPPPPPAAAASSSQWTSSSWHSWSRGSWQ